MAPVVGDLGKAGKYGVKALKAFDKGGDIAKTLNVVRRPISKKGSKTFRIISGGIEKVDDALGAGAKGSKEVGKSGKYSNLGNMSFEDGKNIHHGGHLEKRDCHMNK